MLFLSGLASPNGSVYAEVNRTIEMISYKAIAFSFVGMIFGHIIAPVLESYYKYFVKNEGESSFAQPVPEA